MKVRLDLDKEEAKRAKPLGYRLYSDRAGGGARVYLDDPHAAVEAIEAIRKSL